MKDFKKEASSYTKFMMKELKKMFDGKFKSPMALPKEDKAKFFKHMDKAWKSDKESSVEANDKISKKVNEYFKFLQDQFQQNYKGDAKAPMLIKDPKEKKNFFKQVKQLWEKKKGKEAALMMTENYFKKFDSDNLNELKNALVFTKGKGQMQNKTLHRRLLDSIDDALSSDKVKEEK